MYCIQCGWKLPEDAQFCRQCGKPNNPCGDVSSGGSLGLPEPANTILNEGSELSESAAVDASSSMRSADFGEVGGIVPETPAQENPAPPIKDEPIAGNARELPKSVNVGSIALGLLSVCCLILCVAQGFIPIFLIEGVALGALAWICAVRWPLAPTLLSIVFVISLLLAGLVGITLNRDVLSPHYHYIAEGSVRYRVDERAHRTDRLGTDGWIPVAYDNDPEMVPSNGIVSPVSLRDGSWGLVGGGRRICFLATNDSSYVVKMIGITVEIRNKDGGGKISNEGATPDRPRPGENLQDFTARVVNTGGSPVSLTSASGGLINVGASELVCGDAPRAIADGETWSFSGVQVYGWKR